MAEGDKRESGGGFVIWGSAVYIILEASRVRGKKGVVEKG